MLYASTYSELSSFNLKIKTLLSSPSDCNLFIILFDFLSVLNPYICMFLQMTAPTIMYGNSAQGNYSYCLPFDHLLISIFFIPIFSFYKISNGSHFLSKKSKSNFTLQFIFKMSDSRIKVCSIHQKLKCHLNIRMMMYNQGKI